MGQTVDPRPAHDEPEPLTESALRAAMDESARDVAAGLTVPLDDVLADLDSAARDMPTSRSKRRT